MSGQADRYQNQPWHVRMARRARYQWRVPLDAVTCWWRERRDPDSDVPFRLGFRGSWGLAVGMSHCQMNWVYDWDEVWPKAGPAAGEGESR